MVASAEERGKRVKLCDCPNGAGACKALVINVSTGTQPFQTL